MSELPAPAPAPPAPRRPLPWWLPGLVLGLLAAAVAFVVQTRLIAEPAYRAEAVVQLPPDEPKSKRQQRAFLLQSRDLVTRTLADPAVASLPSVRESADPVADVTARLAVAELAPDVLAVTLSGPRPDDIKVILDHLVRRYVDDASGFDRRERNEHKKKLEQLAEVWRVEIEATEKQVEIVGKASSSAGGEDTAARLALLRQRHIGADAEYNRVNRELTGLEAEATVLKRRAEKKDAVSTLNGDARIAQLATAIEIKREEREKLGAERDALQKLVTNGTTGGVDIDAMRRALVPQREALRKVETRLAEQRVSGALSSRVELRGDAAVTPTRTRADRAADLVRIGIAFAGGFALATAFSFVGLVFSVLRRAAER